MARVSTARIDSAPTTTKPAPAPDGTVKEAPASPLKEREGYSGVDGVADGVAVAVPLTLGVLDVEGVTLGVVLGVVLDDELGVSLGDAEGVPLAVPLADALGDVLAVTLALTLAVSLGV